MQTKRQHAYAKTPHALPIFRTLGIPSGFMLALCAVLNPTKLEVSAVVSDDQRAP